jgi:hypothetical protein
VSFYHALLCSLASLPGLARSFRWLKLSIQFLPAHTLSIAVYTTQCLQQQSIPDRHDEQQDRHRDDSHRCLQLLDCALGGPHAASNMQSACRGLQCHQIPLLPSKVAANGVESIVFSTRCKHYRLWRGHS